MVSPPIDPVLHLPYEDAYKISGRDMEILRMALYLKGRNEDLERKIAALQQRLDECGCGG